jgi:hypothetical protein
MLALFMLDQNPTVTPVLFSPVTWVCTEPGKFSLMYWLWFGSSR